MEQNYNGKKYNPIALANLNRELLRVATCYLKHFQIIMIFRSFLIYFVLPPCRDRKKRLIKTDVDERLFLFFFLFFLYFVPSQSQ